MKATWRSPRARRRETRGDGSADARTPDPPLVVWWRARALFRSSDQPDRPSGRTRPIPANLFSQTENHRRNGGNETNPVRGSAEAPDSAQKPERREPRALFPRRVYAAGACSTPTATIARAARVPFPSRESLGVIAPRVWTARDRHRRCSSSLRGFGQASKTRRADRRRIRPSPPSIDRTKPYTMPKKRRANGRNKPAGARGHVSALPPSPAREIARAPWKPVVRALGDSARRARRTRRRSRPGDPGRRLDLAAPIARRPADISPTRATEDDTSRRASTPASARSAHHLDR